MSRQRPFEVSSAPPGSWVPARRLTRLALAPLERFLQVEASAGLVLMAATLLALLWANSSLHELYGSLWHTPLAIRIGSWVFERDLHFFINDGLMTVFFFVVGLEIRHELHGGELSQLRRAALPLVAAVGGTLAPAGLFMALNHGRSSAAGWGVPMATDIAFAVGVVTLLGKRVPPAVRVLLLALAVIDDVAAILVIAFFYSSGLEPVGFGVVGLGLVAVLAMQLVGVRSPWAYVLPGVVIWAGTYAAGVHPTLAGVVLGLLTPTTAWLGGPAFLSATEAKVRDLRDLPEVAERQLLPHLDAINRDRREAVSPVQRLQHALHGWVAYGIMPLFALANAGVRLSSSGLHGDSLWVFAGVALGLVLGKPFGVVGLSWLAARFGLVALPDGIGWRHLLVLGLAAGIGFTMALFIASLAFLRQEHLETAKLAILLASAFSGVAAYLAGRAFASTPERTLQPPA